MYLKFPISVAVIGFNESERTIYEGGGEVTSSLCVKVFSGTIAPDVSVTYSLTLPSNIPG